MPRGSDFIDVNAPSQVVFDVLHDYTLRLRWDTMLSDARLVGLATRAAKGVRSLCTGTWRSAFLAMETEYITFQPGQVAAVRLTNHPPLFARFAATIRHTPLAAGRSRVTYIYSFRVRPPQLVKLLEPVVARMLAREVQARLVALRNFVERATVTGSRPT